ncbi:hypothetical protein HDU81_004105 [Chytriomyces hyalinus]|nr:hypothetical protein HDU81_004105 [Chytriomyces hyalinus]
MRRMFYTLNNDDQLRAIDVEVDPTAPVSCLKEALPAESSPELDRFDADKLTLVRTFKKGKWVTYESGTEGIEWGFE